MKIHQTPEFIAYCYFDGKMEKEQKANLKSTCVTLSLIKSKTVSST